MPRDYPPKLIESSIERALLVPRDEALKKVNKKSTKRPVFVLNYHPALPSISQILRQAWRTMIRDPYLEKVFPKPPMVAYRKPRGSSLRDKLVKAKIPTSSRTSRSKNGMKKCNDFNCKMCPFVEENTFALSSHSNFRVNINKPVDCNSSNVIYCIKCSKNACNHVQYVGETRRKVKCRFTEHLNYVKTENVLQPTGKHFNLPGHSISDMKIIVLERCFLDSKHFRLEREKYFIEKFATKWKGLNRKL